MTCAHCQGLEATFNRREAMRALRRHRRRGPEKTTRALLHALEREGVAGATVLDIGGGIGAIPNALLEAGASSATDLDASTAYLEAARLEAERRGNSDRIAFHHGDFVALAGEVPAADVVTLDRVICCYPDVVRLVGLSSARARRLYGVVFPRDLWWTRLLIALMNAGLWLIRNPMRAFVHRTVDVDDLLQRAGFTRRFHHAFWFWQVAAWVRTSGDAVHGLPVPQTSRVTDRPASHGLKHRGLAAGR